MPEPGLKLPEGFDSNEVEEEAAPMPEPEAFREAGARPLDAPVPVDESLRGAVQLPQDFDPNRLAEELPEDSAATRIESYREGEYIPQVATDEQGRKYDRGHVVTTLPTTHIVGDPEGDEGTAYQVPMEQASTEVAWSRRRDEGQEAEQAAGDTSATAAVASGVADIAVGGWVDKLAAKIAEGQGIPYEQALESAQQYTDKLRERGAFRGGQALGVGALAALPGPKGGLGSRTLSGATEGAGFGAVHGSGAAESGEELEGAAEGWLIGGAVGAGAPLALSGAERVSRPVRQHLTRKMRGSAQRLQSEADLNRLAQLNPAGGVSKKSLENIEQYFPGGARGAADELRETGITGGRVLGGDGPVGSWRQRALSTPDDSYERALQVRERAGRQVGEFIDAAESPGGLKGLRMKKELMDRGYAEDEAAAAVQEMAEELDPSVRSAAEQARRWAQYGGARLRSRQRPPRARPISPGEYGETGRPTAQQLSQIPGVGRQTAGKVYAAGGDPTFVDSLSDRQRKALARKLPELQDQAAEGVGSGRLIEPGVPGPDLPTKPTVSPEGYVPHGRPEGLPVSRIDPSELATSVRRRVVSPAEANPDPQARRAVKDVDEWAANIEQDSRYREGMTLRQAQDLKRDMSERIDWNRRGEEVPGGVQARMDAERTLRGKIDESLDRFGEQIDDPGMLDRYRKAKRQYGAADTAVDMGQDWRRREATRRKLSMSDMLTGVAASGSLLYGGLQSEGGGGGELGFAGVGASILANRFYRRRDAAIAATAQEAVADLLQKAPRALGKYAQPLIQASRRGSEALAAQHFVLWQRDPEYRRLIKKSAEGGDEETDQ